ncbi:MAG: ABC transporter permease subunit [Verrucomicrobia bacterium]|nr:ABC transporter permease subunit [Verrucomicrobiota bacterium]
MKKHSPLLPGPLLRLRNFVLLTLLAGVFLCGLLYFFGWLLRPDLDRAPFLHDAESLARIVADRDVSFDPENPLVLHQEVDPTEGPDAAWFPKGESPILTELVAEGRLPPVHERTGPEPVVMRGVEGTGNYGGTWYRVASSEGDIGVMSWRMSGSYLLRWSPFGYPLKPHLAKSWEASEDRREFTVTLREGLRWSDGAPFTTDDILYWWEQEVQHFGQNPNNMMVQGELGEIERVDDLTVRFHFPHPHALFPERLATGTFWSPKHYLAPYHPETGDAELRERMRRVQGVPTDRAAYFRLNDFRNPERPQLWPWVMRAHQTTPPFEFVRNPYYYVVDTEGNQLPYIDRILFDVRSEGMISLTAASGDISMQLRNIRFDDYTLYMEESVRNNFQVYHWFQATRSSFTVFPNLNRRVEPDRPETRWKHEFLNKLEFRKALSLAIDRAEIIRADFHGQSEPAQIDPGPESPFHHPPLFHAYTEHDPERAKELLDGIGLDQRDGEGYRVFPDGTRMTFYLHVTDYTGTGPSHFLIDHWARVGIRVILREQARSLWQRLQSGLQHDLTVWSGESEFLPLLEPRNFVPTALHAFHAPGYATWYSFGGLQGNPEAAARPLAIEPPEGSPIRRNMEVLDAAIAAPTLEEQVDIFREALQNAAENIWTISIGTPPPQLVIVQNGFRNVPRNAMTGAAFHTPANAGIETYFLDEPVQSPGATAQIKRLMIAPDPDPRLTLTAARGQGEDGGPSAGQRVSGLLRFLVRGILLLGFILLIVKHPFIGRRCLILIPTLFVISVAVFTIIQLPPGDYVEMRIIELEMEGDDAAVQQIQELKDIFHLEAPLLERYLRWMGVYWFVGFDSSDAGLLQGSLGRSMEDTRLVNDIVGDRILLTFLISLFTILFTWLMAIPIGIYSAVRQYSFGDYFFTIIGFIGMCIPNFLLAILLMYFSSAFLDTQISGLFSPEFAAQPEWTWAKFVDLLKHVWVPVVVLGTAGTAWMIRVMRANLLDELRKPYVVTARAKGVRPFKLLMKYPVRLALNPFISGIGGIFPQLISGGAIVAIVLSLPTVGPLLLNSLMAQDMYLAGSMLMVLSLLSVFGTLVSDLLLMWVDPRIRIGK